MPRKTSNLPPLDLTGAQLELVPESTMAERKPRRGTAERSKTQKALDALVEKAYDKWVAAGRPETFAETPGGHVKVPEGQLVQVTRAIHSAGRFYDLKIRFGSVVQEGGYVDVVFTATDRPVKPVKDAE